MFCCLRLLNGVCSGQFIFCELSTLLVYFALFVYSKVYVKLSYFRDEFFALNNFNGKVNYLFASRKCFTIAVTSYHSRQTSVEFTMWQSY